MSEQPPEYDATPDYLHEYERMLAADESDGLLRIGRKLKALAEQKAEQARFRLIIQEETQREIDRLDRAIAPLNQLVEQVLLTRREHNPEYKALDIPNVGRWASRSVSDGWEIDERAAYGALDADLKRQFTRTKETLDTPAFRQYLDSMKPDIQPEDIAGHYEGVAYRPARINVTSPFKEA